MKAADLYHTGLVADDFDATVALLTETAGGRRTGEYRGHQLVQTQGGQATVEMRIVYSVTEPRTAHRARQPGARALDARMVRQAHAWRLTISGLGRRRRACPRCAAAASAPPPSLPAMPALR